MLVVPILVAVVALVAVWMQRSRPGPAPPPTAPAGDTPARPTRVSLLVEAVAYIGTVLVLAGVAAAFQRSWHRLGDTPRLTVLAVATVLFLGAGLFARRTREPALQRLTGVVWAVSVATFAGSVGVVGAHYELSGQAQFVLVATSATAYAAALWAAQHQALQESVLFLGTLVSVAAIVNAAVAEPDPWMVAVPIWAVALAWAAAGWWRRVAPWSVAVALGVVAALLAPATIGDPNALRFGLGIATAAAVMTVGVLVDLVPALALGAAAALGYTVGAVTYYFGGTLGVPASLAVAGLVVLAGALAAVRWRPGTGHGATTRPATGRGASGQPATGQPATGQRVTRAPERRTRPHARHRPPPTAPAGPDDPAARRRRRPSRTR